MGPFRVSVLLAGAWIWRIVDRHLGSSFTRCGLWGFEIRT